MTDKELADLRKQAKAAMEHHEDVAVCPNVLLELVRGVEWGRYIEAKYQPKMQKEADDALKRLAYPPSRRRVKAGVTATQTVEDKTSGSLTAENASAGPGPGH